MLLYLASLRKVWYAFLIVVLFSMCKKKSGPVDPDDMVEKDQGSLTSVSQRVNRAFGGYYISLPALYAKTTKTYPVIVFLHGAGQTGNGTSDLPYILNDGIGKVLKEGRFPPNFSVDGKNYSFIVASPQYDIQPTVDEVAQFVLYIRNTYRVDIKHIYMSGLSLGARMVTLAAAQYPDALAAIVPIAGVALNPGMEDRCLSIAHANLPVWELHNQDDPMADVKDVANFIDLINSFNPGVPPRFTVFDVYGHDAWTTALDPLYKENGMNIYEWMLQFSR